MKYLFQNLLNLRRVAAYNRLHSDDVWQYIEKCYRYYSKTYHVSLLEAKEKITIEEVVLIHMEDELEDMELESVLEMLKTIENPELPVALYESEEVAGDDVSDDEWIAQQNLQLKKQDEAKKLKQAEDIAKRTHEALEQLTNSFQKMENSIKEKDTNNFKSDSE